MIVSSNHRCFTTHGGLAIGSGKRLGLVPPPLGSHYKNHLVTKIGAVSTRKSHQRAR